MLHDLGRHVGLPLLTDVIRRDAAILDAVTAGDDVGNAGLYIGAHSVINGTLHLIAGFVIYSCKTSEHFTRG